MKKPKKPIPTWVVDFKIYRFHAQIRKHVEDYCEVESHIVIHPSTMILLNARRKNKTKDRVFVVVKMGYNSFDIEFLHIEDHSVRHVTTYYANRTIVSEGIWLMSTSDNVSSINTRTEVAVNTGNLSVVPVVNSYVQGHHLHKTIYDSVANAVAEKILLA